MLPAATLTTFLRSRVQKWNTRRHSTSGRILANTLSSNQLRLAPKVVLALLRNVQ